MSKSTRSWWKHIIERLGCASLIAQLLAGGAWADSPRTSNKRIPMRVASHSTRQPTSPAVPEPVANAVTEHEFEDSYEDAYEGAYIDEGVDQATNFSPVWGPVWYGDCETACRPNCGPRCAPRWWVNAEYLLWFQRGTTLPPLVTTSFQGTTLEDAGVLGLSTTSVLYGDQTVGNSSQSGGRLTVGMWLDDCEDAGFGGRGFTLDTQNDSFDASSGTVPILARPYFDVSDDQMSQQNSLIIAYPGVQTGQVNVSTSTDLAGGDLFLRRRIHTSHLSRVDFWLGYQFTRITGDLTINSTSTEVSGAQLDVFDQFATRNEFHAATLGFLAEIDRERWRCEFLAKIGLGRMHQSASLSGSNTLTDGQTDTTSPVGLLVRSTNSGLHANDTFSVSPEIGVNWMLKLTCNLELSVGYSFVYWTNVLTPADVIDPNLAVNLADIPAGAQSPGISFRDQDYWIHGVSFGLAGRF